MEIRPLRISDYEDVVCLWKQCEGIVLGSADSYEKIDLYLKRNHGMSFIARKCGVLAGAVLCGHDGRRGYIHHLAVYPEFRKHGIGKRLVAECLAALESVGIEKCHIFVLRDNEQGLIFWETAGWALRNDIGIMSMNMK